MWDLIVLVLDHCLSFNFAIVQNESKLGNYGECVFSETVA